MKKALLSLAVLIALGGSVYAYYRYRDTGPAFTVTTAAVTRGDVIDTVGATGTLQAVTTVQVGTQVSGTIQSLYADFNSLVKKGEVIARLDPSLFQTQIEQAQANLLRSQADLERLKVALDDAKTKLARAKELSGRQLIPQSELDTADVNVRAAEAQLRSADAQVTQAQASLNQNQVNLQHTVIEAPIDGLVISRSVDVGQTVAASMQAPTLFVLAADLTKMQVLANLDESDVGRIRPGQQVIFRVDAYPTEDFRGSVSQVRLNPIVQQNVVTYATVIDVPNDELKLKPGMTANVTIEIAHSANALRIPNSALRFRPTPDMYAAIGQTPDASARGDLGRGRAGRGGEATPGPLTPSGDAPAATASTPRGGTPTAAESTGAAAQTPRISASGEGSAATHAPAAGRMRGRGGNPATAGVAPQHGRGAVAADASLARGGATTIDALFGPLTRVEAPGRVWLYADKQLKPLRIRVGITDGQATELLDGDVEQGMELVTNIATTGTTRPAATSGFPLGQQRRGGFQGGGNRGGAGPAPARGR
jgi:HlyD family secretion protein